VAFDDLKSLGVAYSTVSGGGSLTANVTANFGETKFKYPMPKGYHSYSSHNSRVLFQDEKQEIKSIESSIASSVTAIPKMTSDTAPYGKVIYTPPNFYQYPYMAFNKADDFGWSPPQYVLKGSIGYNFETEKKIMKYSVRSLS
ncbi:hypothetical protein ACFVRU_29805, partial [Streptomyces sp. NPDC057927]